MGRGSSPVPVWVRVPRAQAVSAEDASRTLVTDARERFAQTDKALAGRESWDELYRRFREWALDVEAHPPTTDDGLDYTRRQEASFERSRLDEAHRSSPRPADVQDVWGWRGWGAVGALLAAVALLSRRGER